MYVTRSSSYNDRVAAAGLPVQPAGSIVHQGDSVSSDKQKESAVSQSGKFTIVGVQLARGLNCRFIQKGIRQRVTDKQKHHQKTVK